MRKTLVLILFALLSLGALYGQYIVNFEGDTETKASYASGTVNLSGMDWDMTEALIGTSTADWKNGAKSARMRGHGTSVISMLADKTTGLGTLSFQYRRYGTDPQVDWKAEYSTDGGTTWFQTGSVFTAPASDDVQTFSSIVNVSGNARIRIKRATETGTANARLNIDDITLTDYSGSATPTINISGTLAPFNTIPGIPSAVQSYNLSGTNLTQQILITLPAGFQCSPTISGPWYTGTNVVPPGYNAPIYIRLLNPTAGTFGGNITHTSIGAIQVDLPISGTVTDPVPTITVDGTLDPFTAIVGTPSASQDYSLSGAFLTGNIIISAPAGFEMSLDNATNWQQSFGIAGNSTWPMAIYVRLTGTALGTYEGNITHTSTGATQVDLAVSGTVSEPSGPTTFFEDNFNYLAGSLLTDNGWTAHSGTNNFPVVGSEGLSYTGYYAYTGLSAQTIGDGADVSKTFASQTTGAIYTSFLLNVNDANTTGDYVYHFGTNPMGTDFKGKFFVKKNDNFQLAFGISKASNYNSTVLPAYTDFVYSVNTTYLVVVKYVFVDGAANDEVYLFVNPAIGPVEPAHLLAAPDFTGTDITNIGAVAIRQNTRTPIAKIDGIRVTNDWPLLWAGTPPATPIISVTGELAPFACYQNNPSEEIQTYTVSGTDLMGGITAIADMGFELSLNGVDDWGSGLFASGPYPQTIYVRMLASSVGEYSGNIVHTSPSATPVNLPVSGECFPPDVTWNVTNSMTDFNTQAGTPSAAQSYTLNALNATGDITVTTSAPYQLGTTASGPWMELLTYASTYNGPVYVRFNPTGAGTFGGTINHSTAGVGDYQLNVNGTATPAPGMAADLFFSEYIEGASNNKAIEIFNGTGGPVDLSDYKVELYANGATAPGNTLVLTGTLDHGDVYVIANASANATILGLADVTSTITYYNGDDALAIKKISTDSYVDIFGVIGQDPDLASTPTLGWIADGGYATVNKTLVRKPIVSQGISVNPTITGPNVNTDFVTLATEWDVYPIDTISYLGSHTFNPSGNPMAATPSFDPPAGTYLNPINVVITSATPGATIYYTTDGSVPDNTSNQYMGAVPISATTTLKAIAYAPGFDPSSVAIGIYSFPTNVIDIEALRAMPAGATVYRLTGEAVLTFQQANRHQKYIQDATAAILIDDYAGIITSTYNLYDGITGIAGTLATYSGLLQFVPVADPGPATSTNNVVVPAVRTLATITSDDQARLLKIMNVTLDATTVNFQAVAENINATDASGTGVMRTFPATDYSGTPIPVEPVDVVCLGGQYNTTMQFSPRSLADITPAAGTLEAPIVSISEAGGIVTLNWTAVAGATSYRIEVSNDPYGIYTTVATGITGTTWNGDAVAMKFFRVIAMN